MEFTLVYRSKIIMNAYKGWLAPHDRVLDIGCGNAVVTDELRKHFSCAVTGVDVLDYRRREIPFFRLASARHLPFSEGDFSVCMFNDVLHHCREWEPLLKEALRISNRVLIFDTEATFVARVLDVLINFIHNPMMNPAINLKASKEWMGHLDRMGMRFEYRDIPKPSIFYPFKHFSFNLGRKEGWAK